MEPFTRQDEDVADKLIGTRLDNRTARTVMLAAGLIAVIAFWVFFFLLYL